MARGSHVPSKRRHANCSAWGAGGVVAMTHIRNLLLVLTLLALGGVRERSAWAQAPGTPTSAPPAPEGWSELAVVGLTALALLIILVLAVRLYDRSRKREADAIGLQSRLSDALLTD